MCVIVLMRLVIAFFSVTASSGLFAQDIRAIDSTTVLNYPVQNATVYRYEYRSGSIYTEPGGVMLLAGTDSVFHFECGKVAAVFVIDDFFAVVVRNTDDEYFIYSNLKSAAVKKNDELTQGSFIGQLLKNENGKYQLNFLMMKNTSEVPPGKIIKYVNQNISAGKALALSL